MGPFEPSTACRSRFRAVSVIAVLGANGAGKTSMLRTICGLARLTAGRVLLEGKDVTGLAVRRSSGGVWRTSPRAAA